MRLLSLPLLVTAAFVASTCQAGGLAPVMLPKPQTAPAGNTGKLVLLRGSESRVEVGADGRVIAVQSDPALPPAVAAALADNIRKVAFAPPVKDGHAVPGVTYVWQDACAAPVDGAYRMAVKFRGNGPSLVQRLFPRYPHDAMMAREHAEWVAEFDVQPDGSVKLHDAKRIHGSNRRFDGSFREMITQWIEAQRFRPEELAGTPVGTRMSTQVEFGVDDRSMRMKDVRKQPASANDSCQLALSGDASPDQRVALDSAFRPLHLD
jgi:hypothetical protein